MPLQIIVSRAAGHQIEEVSGFVFRSKRRAAPASPGRAKRLCSPEQRTDSAGPPVSRGQPFSAVANNEQLPADPNLASPAEALRDHLLQQQASDIAHAALPNGPRPHVVQASDHQSQPGTRSSPGQIAAAAAALPHGPLAKSAADVDPAQAPMLHQNNMDSAAQLNSPMLPGQLSRRDVCMYSSAEAQGEHAQQDPRQPAPDLAHELDGSAVDADPLHQQPAAGVSNACGNVPLEAESEQHTQQQTDRVSAAGLPAASKGSMAELEPLLKRVTAISEVVKAQHPPEPIRESAAEADRDGAVPPSAPEAVSKVCCCDKQVIDPGFPKLPVLGQLNCASDKVPPR